MTFPVGATLDGGRYRLMEWLRGHPEAGQYMAIGPKGACLVTTTSPVRVSYDEALDRLGIPAAGVSPVRYIGPLESDDGPLDALVEALPRGKAGHTLGTLSVQNALALATAVAHDMARAHANEILYGGLRPELVFVEEDDPMTVMVAPRAEPWVRLGGPRKEGGVLFERTYSAPEQVRAAKTSAAGDVFSLAATLAFWLGAAPFGKGQLGEQMDAIVSGVRDFGAVPTEIARALDAALAVEPAKRPSAADFCTTLRKLNRA